MTAALRSTEILAPLHDLSPDQRSEAVWFVLGWLVGANPVMAAQAVASAVADQAGHLDP